MKEHLIKFHKTAAAHHVALAKAHAAHSSAAFEHHDDLPEDHELRKFLKATGKHHDAMAKLHTAYAEEHVKLGKALAPRGDWHDDVEPDEPSALGGGGDVATGDLHGPRKVLTAFERAQAADRLVAQNVRGVLPDAPARPNKLVPRFGGPSVDTSGLDTELLKVFGE